MLRGAYRGWGELYQSSSAVSNSRCCLLNFDMANRRNIELEDLDPIDKKKLIGRFEVFQSGVSDLKKAAEGEEPLFSLEDEP